MNELTENQIETMAPATTKPPKKSRAKRLKQFLTRSVSPGSSPEAAGSTATEIKGYSTLSEAQREFMNRIKELEILAGELHKEADNIFIDGKRPDDRSLSIAKTHLQTGFMWFNRAIAKPADFYK